MSGFNPLLISSGGSVQGIVKVSELNRSKYCLERFPSQSTIKSSFDNWIKCEWEINLCSNYITNFNFRLNRMLCSLLVISFYTFKENVF